jgi:tryptophan 2,3-dioxygenase
MLFVVIHQVYELWFKQILQETGLLQHRLEAGDGSGALATARRIAKILKTAVAQMDVLETMTPQQFAGFRPDLGGSSGFQSYQFRRIEAAFGRRDFGEAAVDSVLDEIMGRRSVFESLLCYLNACGWRVPADVLSRDPREPWLGNGHVLALLAEVYDDARTPAEVCESLVDVDEGIQEWRYRHVKAVERIIGAKAGTGDRQCGYLRSTLFGQSPRPLEIVRGLVVPSSEARTSRGRGPHVPRPRLRLCPGSGRRFSCRRRCLLRPGPGRGTSRVVSTASRRCRGWSRRRRRRWRC